MRFLVIVFFVLLVGFILLVVLVSLLSSGGGSRPAGSPQVLLSEQGTGIKATDEFTASGGQVHLSYGYDCWNFGMAGNFIVTLYAGTTLRGVEVNELGKSKTGSTTIYLDGSGPYHLEVNSECTWAVIVAGRP